MRKLLLLALVLCTSGSLLACGDDGGSTPPPGDDAGGGGTDTGTGGGDNCDGINGAPDVDGLMGACCYRTDQSADTLNFRLSALGVSTPPVLASPVVSGLLGPALNEERFNWLFRVEGAGADGDVTLTTGFAFRDPGPVYRFSNGDAPPADGDPARWDPATVTGNISAGVLSSPASPTPITVPIFNAEATMVTTELPLRNLEMTFGNLSEENRCIGAFTANRVWDTREGEVQAFITVADAMDSAIDVPPLDTTLCNLIAGLQSTAGCDMTAQGDWNTPPDSTCDGAGTCTEGGCDGATTCDAWRLRSGFSAQAVPTN